jgi:hypothetical protein
VSAILEPAAVRRILTYLGLPAPSLLRPNTTLTLSRTRGTGISGLHFFFQLAERVAKKVLAFTTFLNEWRALGDQARCLKRSGEFGDLAR